MATPAPVPQALATAPTVRRHDVPVWLDLDARRDVIESLQRGDLPARDSLILMPVQRRRGTAKDR